MGIIGPRRVRRRGRRLAALLGTGVIGLIPATAAEATTPLGDQLRISFTGADGDATVDAADAASAYNPRARQHLVAWMQTRPGMSRVVGQLVNEQGTRVGPVFGISSDPADLAFQPAVAYNSRSNEYLVAFQRDTGTPGEQEIYVQRVSAAGAEIGPDVRISHAGPDGSPTSDADDPAVVVNEARNEYLVVWEADVVPDEQEIYAQRLSADATEIGPDDLRVSDMGPPGDVTYHGADTRVAWNARRDEYMVVWHGDDDTPPVAEGELEIYVQRLSGDGAELGPDDRRITNVGPPGDLEWDSDDPAIAYNPIRDEYLVAFEGEGNPLSADENEIYIQRLAYDGSEVGTDDQRISDIGPDGDATYGGLEPRVTFNERADEYLVVWWGTDDVPPLVAGKNEIFAQRVSGAGQELGANDTRVSLMPNEGDGDAGATLGALDYDSQSNTYLVAWEGVSTLAPLVAAKSEIYIRRFGAGTPVATASVSCKALPPARPAVPGNPSKVTLSSAQLLINQRISQAAVRRANGVDDWFTPGVESRDLCQAAVGSSDLYAGSLTGYTGLPVSYGQPDPRPVVVPPAKPGNPSKVTLSTTQLLINQRISQAAIRRLNALKARLDSGLTGGDLKDGSVGRAQLAAGIRVLYAPVLANPPAASTTDVPAPTRGDPSKVTLSAAQLLINQRISQAAVRRANELVRRLEGGIGSGELRDGSLTAADLAPGLPASTTP